MVEIWLVRHGETLWTIQGKVTGWTDITLSDRARQQAAGLQARLQGHDFFSVWASDMSRTCETASLAWGPVRHDSRLRELNFGEWEGRVWDEMAPDERQSLLDFEGFCAPCGEPVERFRQRVLDFLGELKAGRHLLFVHAGLIRLLLREVGNDRFLPPASLVGLDWTERKLLFIEVGPAD